MAMDYMLFGLEMEKILMKLGNYLRVVP